jgi:hypothetical protein
MSQAEFEREFARQTGESLATIRRRGFQLLEMPEPEPQVVDWDTLQQERVSYVPQRARMRKAA